MANMVFHAAAAGSAGIAIKNGIIHGMTVTMDSAGRIVLPKTIRERARLTPGAKLDVRVVDGRVELEPACARVRIEKKGGFWVAKHIEAVPTLTQEQVEATLEGIRMRSIKDDEP